MNTKKNQVPKKQSYEANQINLVKRDADKISFDLNSVKRPDRKFCSDGFSINYEYSQYNLNFFQRGIGGTLRALLQVRMNDVSFENLIKSIARFDNEINDTKEDSQFLVRDVVSEPAQTIAFEASVTKISISRGCSHIDFYYFPNPHEMKNTNLNSIGIEEVASINICESMANSFVIALRKISQVKED